VTIVLPVFSSLLILWTAGPVLCPGSGRGPDPDSRVGTLSVTICAYRTKLNKNMVLSKYTFNLIQYRYKAMKILPELSQLELEVEIALKMRSFYY
jgi:hypothetical protein